MKRKLILPAIVGVWCVAIGMLVFLNGELHELYSKGVLPLETVDTLTNRIFYGIPIITGFITVVLYGYLSHLTRQVTEPVQQLLEETKSFGRKPTHALRQYYFDELNSLAIAYDKIGERQYRTVRKLEYQKTKAESVVAHLEDGILILDEEGYVVEFNEKCRSYLQMPQDLRQCEIRYLLRDEGCIHMLKTAFETGKPASCEWIKKDKVLHLRMAQIADEQKSYGYIITITDLTKTRKLEAVRYQFMSNVTHELKTPLTSIQGFVETLQNGAINDPKIAMRFLGIIDEESKRLHRLIQNVLLLSEIETMHETFEEYVSVNQVIKDVVTLLEDQANKKEIKLCTQLDVTLQLEGVHGDHMKQLILNLVSNAIKYTDEGEVVVTLGQTADNRYYFSVQDTGIGMDETHLDHIFERFYRVDKSRSRKSGGTGLGLSIAKHITQHYGWELTVASVPQKGSTFKIYF